MSINELIYYIQLGDDTLYPELWEKIQRFVMKQARIYFDQLGGRYGVEQADLINSGYIAMCKAVSSFDIFRGNSFFGWLIYALKNEWADLCGFKSTRRDALNVSQSLDEPQTEDTDDALIDLIVDENAPNPEEIAERKDEILWLKTSVDSFIKMLPDELERIVRQAYLQGMKTADIANMLGLSTKAVSRYRTKAISRLRSLARRTPLGQKLKAHYMGAVRLRHVGAREFNTTHTSEVERYVIDLERKELLTWEKAPYSEFNHTEMIILSAYRHQLPELQLLAERYFNNYDFQMKDGGI